ncbi:MAG: hypothetical protein JNL21_00190 [Myxococcales bacterium]|nr:hypothetical protein [Myxococcales bacterium]
MKRLALKRLAAVLSGAVACSSAPASPGAGGADGAAATKSSSSGGTGESSSSTGLYSTCGIENGQHPDSVPPNWVRWTCDPGCVFWLPPDRASLPSPIEWEACPDYSTHAECRKMSTPWSDGERPTGLNLAFDVDPSGTARLMIARIARDTPDGPELYLEWALGQVDGPLEFAMRRDYPPRCYAHLRQLHHEVFAFSLDGDGTLPINNDIDALMIGYVGSLEPVMPYRNPEVGSSAWSIGPKWVLQQDLGSKITAHTHDFSESFLFYGAHMSPDFSPYNGKAFHFGSEVVFQAVDYSSAGIWAYDEARGTHPLVTFPGDTTQGAANLGTDGVDLVWTHGTGKELGAFGLYPSVSIMTAPYTTDPAAIEPRRLRKDLNLGIGTKELQFAVGCGYAGRGMATSRDVQIVRLEDGAGWVLEGSDVWKYISVLGFTCDEVFLLVMDQVTKEIPAIVRMPLSALGEPLPPD